MSSFRNAISFLAGRCLFDRRQIGAFEALDVGQLASECLAQIGAPARMGRARGRKRGHDQSGARSQDRSLGRRMMGHLVTFYESEFARTTERFSPPLERRTKDHADGRSLSRLKPLERRQTHAVESICQR